MTAIPTPAPKNDFSDLVNLLEQLSQAENDHRVLESELNASHLAAVRLHVDRYKEIARITGETKAALEVLAARNPSWFEERQTLGTPFGELKRTSSTSLVIADEAVTIALIRAAKRQDDFLRIETHVNKEALEALGDDELAKYGVARKTTYHYKAAGAGVDLGKAVKAAEKSEGAAKKTAKRAAAAAAGMIVLAFVLWLFSAPVRAESEPLDPVYTARVSHLLQEAAVNRNYAHLFLAHGFRDAALIALGRVSAYEEQIDEARRAAP
jgi:hypothetical protein